MSEPSRSSATSNIARQSIALLSSGVVGYVLSLIMGIVLARWLGVEAYGGWVVAFSLANTISVFGLLGADWLLMRQGSHLQSTGDEEGLRRTIHVAFFLSGAGLLMSAAALIVAAPLLASNVFDRPELVGSLRLAAVLGVVLGVGSVLLYAAQAFRKVRQIALIRNVAGPVLRLGLVIAAASLGGSPETGLLAVLVAELIVVVLATRALMKLIRLRGPSGRTGAGGVTSLAMPAWGSRLVETGRAQMFPLLLGAMAGTGAAGVFSVGRRISSAPGSVIATLNRVYTPIASAAFLGEARATFVDAYRNVGRWSYTIGVPLFCLTIAAPRALLGLFGPGFVPWAPALVILAFGMLVSSATGPVTTTLIVTGRARLAFLDYVAAFVLEVGLGVWLIPRMGVLGAAIARASGTALNNLVPLWQVWRGEHVHPYDRSYLKPSAAGLAAFGAAVGAGSLLPATAGAAVRTTVAAATVGVVYSGVLLALGLPKADRDALRVLGEDVQAVRSLRVAA